MPFKLGQIERYVLIRTLLGVAMALAVISTIILLINFVELTRTVGVKAKDVSAVEVLGLALLESPTVILILLPFAFLFGVLGAFVNLNRRSELIAMRAAGVSAWRFIFPAAGAAVVIGVLTVMAFNPVASAMSDQFQKLQTKLMEGYLDDKPKAIWIRQGDKQRQMIIRAASNEGPGVHLKDISLFLYTLDPDGSLRFSRRIDAREARLQHGQWLLIGAKEGQPGEQAKTFDAVTVPSNLNERTALERFSSPAAIPFWGLPGVISRTQKAGFSATVYRLQFQQLLATPLMFAAMSILGAAFSLRLLRLGGLAGLAGSGVALGFVFFFMNQLCNALGKGDVIPTVVAAWTPPLLALLAGLTLLCYTEDG
jgi:lipopolysaccharide export system permease protein